MSVPSSFIDGRRFLASSPFRSPYFLAVTALALSAVLVDLAVLYINRRSAHETSLVLAGLLVATQLGYQWWRALRYYSRIRFLYKEKPENDAREGSNVDLALRTATGGIVDLLFYFYGITLVLLILIGLMTTSVN